MNIGERIKIRRTALNLSQRELAELTGYSNHSTIARIESGKVDLPQSKIVQFAEVLNTTIAYLMGWEEEIEKNPVGMAERHIEIIMDEDIAEIFEDFRLCTDTMISFTAKCINLTNDKAFEYVSGYYAVYGGFSIYQAV